LLAEFRYWTLEPEPDDAAGLCVREQGQACQLSAVLYIGMNHTQLEMLDQHYTVAEVARLLNVHEMTVRDWYWKGNLKIQRVGRKGVRIAAWDLKVFLAQLNEDRVA
jgi:excisionase family DNA binding protein